MLRDYFRLREGEEYEDDIHTNMRAVIEADKLDLNNIFGTNVEKSKFFSEVKHMNSSHDHDEAAKGDDYDHEKREAIMQYYL